MTKDEALKLALEALEKKAGSWGVGQKMLNKAAIAAVKEALAQPAQEPKPSEQGGHMTRVRVRDWAAERRARELRKLLAEIDPHPVSTPPTPSPAMSLWECSTYRPEQMTPVRPGADNNQRYKSRGM
jgi:hypothetical protein